MVTSLHPEDGGNKVPRNFGILRQLRTLKTLNWIFTSNLAPGKKFWGWTSKCRLHSCYLNTPSTSEGSVLSVVRRCPIQGGSVGCESFYMLIPLAGGRYW